MHPLLHVLAAPCLTAGSQLKCPSVRCCRRYWRATRQPGSEEVLELVPPGEPVGHGKPSQLVSWQCPMVPTNPLCPPCAHPGTHCFTPLPRNRRWAA
jgi:hypothetical protein